MKKKLIILAVLSIIGIGTIATVNILRFQSIETVDQTAQDIQQLSNTSAGESAVTLVRQGMFINGDALHRGRGIVSQVITSEGTNMLQFKNFDVTPGPDLYVYLSKNPNAVSDKDPGEFVSLGKLQNTSGDQVYNLPDNADEYQSVFVWCRAFGVAFTVAQLK